MNELALILAALLAPAAQQDTTYLRVEPGTISIGDSATISWSVEGVDSVFISSLGVVPSQGTRLISSGETTTFLLVADFGGSTLVRDASLLVTGGMRNGAHPDAEEFLFPYQFTYPDSSFRGLISRVYEVLQNDLGYSVQTITGPYEDVTLVTTRLEKDDLVSADEPQIARRRIAFRVDIPKPEIGTTELVYEILATIQYRRRIERRWRPERNQVLYNREALLLATKIGRIQ